MNKVKYILFGLVIVIVAQTSCAIKEYADPSSISDTQVVSTVDGLIGLCNGLQLRYTVGRQSPIYQSFSASGLLAGEQKLLNLGNTDELALVNGGSAVVAANTITTGIWTQSYLLVNESNRILDNLKVATDPSVLGTLQAYGSMYKALAFGTLAMYFEKMPVTLGKNQPFVSREDALRQAVALLENAEKVVPATIPASISGKLVAGVDLKNSVIALQARYNLMLKDYAKALAAANKVSLTAKSVFNYDAVNVNPIFFNSFSNRNVLEPVNRAFGLPTALAPDTLDKRIPFYINPATVPQVANLGLGFARSNTSAIPVYLPGEIRLIKAECLAQSDINGAIAELNGVIKKKVADDPFGVGADIATGYTGATTKDAVLAEIYRQRSIELAFSGLRFEDSRRLGRPGPDAPIATRERGRNFIPYPQSERDNNKETPADPAN